MSTNSKIYSIYSITNIINGKRYIGWTSRPVPETRWKEHIKTKKSKISRAIKRFGIKNFHFEVLCQCKGNKTDGLIFLKEMEPYFIQKYNSFNEGYNSTKGGGGISGIQTGKIYGKMILARSFWSRRR